jgi:hypothetical protein
MVAGLSRKSGKLRVGKILIFKKMKRILALVVGVFLFLSFTNKGLQDKKYYGGTASVTVEVDFSLVGGASDGYVLALKQKGIKEGSRRVIEVSTDCDKLTQADAQGELQSSITSAKERYEKLTTSIHYRVSSCIK